MSYAIIRNTNHKMNAVPLLKRHNERRNKNYSNKDIDLSRSSKNYNLKQIQASTYQQEFERIRQTYNLKGNLRLSGEKQSNVMCEFVITSYREFFERLGAERTKRFFADALIILLRRRLARTLWYRQPCIWTRQHLICTLHIFPLSMEKAARATLVNV